MKYSMLRKRLMLSSSQGTLITGAITLANTLAVEPDVISMDSTDMSMVIRDTATPANNFIGDPNTKLTYTSPSTKWILGANGLYQSGTTLRTEYNTSGVAQGLRVEEARTNICLRSNDFSVSPWSNNSVTAAANAVGPDGAANSASTITASAGNSTHFINQTITTSAGATTASAFVKYTNHRWLMMRINDGTTSFFASFDLLNGVVGTTGGPVTNTMTSVGNGYYMITATATTVAAVGSILFALNNADSASITTWNATGTETFVATFAKVEAGAFATSPIVTTSATVTRAADNISIATSLFPATTTECTLYSKFIIREAATATHCPLNIGDGTGNERGSLTYNQATFTSAVVDGGAAQAVFNAGAPAVAVGSTFKFAMGYKANLASSFINGVQLGSDDVTVTMPSPTSVTIGHYEGTTFHCNSHIQQIMILPRRLSNTDLPTLTA